MRRLAVARTGSPDRRTPFWRAPGIDAEVLAHLRQLFPDLGPEAPLRYRRLAVSSWHTMVVAEAGPEPGRRLLLKGPAADQSPAGRERQAALMAVEHRLLTEVAPRIWAANPAARCPLVVAYDPKRPLLMLEMVDGRDLKSVLFGRGPAPGPHELLALLGLCGGWLARFHALTRRHEAGDPLAWLVAELEAPEARLVLERALGGQDYRTLHRLAQAVRTRHPTLRTPLCMAHGVFAPYHVLVQDGRIYVIDLESSHVGYPWEDLALFVGYYDALLPWRRARSAARLDLDRQRQAFLEAYRAHTGPAGPGEDAVMALARLRAVTRIACYRDMAARRRTARSRLLRPWLRHRIRVVSREVLGVLRQEGGGPGPACP